MSKFLLFYYFCFFVLRYFSLPQDPTRYFPMFSYGSYKVLGWVKSRAVSLLRIHCRTEWHMALAYIGRDRGYKFEFYLGGFVRWDFTVVISKIQFLDCLRKNYLWSNNIQVLKYCLGGSDLVSPPRGLALWLSKSFWELKL